MRFLLGVGVGALISTLLSTVAYAERDKSVAALSNDPEAKTTEARQSSKKYFAYTNKSGVRSFSDKPPPAGIRYVEKEFFSCFACNPRSTVDWNKIPLHLNSFQYAIDSASRKYQVDPALVRAVIHAESAFKPTARSRKGAQGLMQLMPETAKDMGVVNAMVPEENIFGGVRYLAWLLEENRGNTKLATAAYNAGPGAVKRYNGIPPFAETQTYVKRVRILHDRYKEALGKRYSGSSVSRVDS